MAEEDSGRVSGEAPPAARVIEVGPGVPLAGSKNRDAQTAKRVSVGRCDPRRSAFVCQGTHHAPPAVAVARQRDRRCEDRDQERERDNGGPARDLLNSRDALPKCARIRIRQHGDLHQDHLRQVRRLARTIGDFVLPYLRSIPPSAMWATTWAAARFGLGLYRLEQSV